jgi:hypothetical protein
MEAHNRISFEIKKEDRAYRLDIPNNAPLGEAYQVIGQFMDKIVELINEHQKKQKENPPCDEVACGKDV